MFGNSLRRKRSNFLLCSTMDDHFSPLPPVGPKAVEPFRSRTEKLFRRINPFALIRTLATIPSSPRERRGFINYSCSIPLSIPGIRASIIVDMEQFLNNELLTGENYEFARDENGRIISMMRTSLFTSGEARNFARFRTK